MKTIYLDNAATTAVNLKVFAAMKPYFIQKYGNASEFHLMGRQAREAVEGSRAKVAKFFGAKTDEIIFTGSATESINLSHKGLIEAVRHTSFAHGHRPHIITTAIEHKAVLETCRHLESIGWAVVTYLPVDRFGRVDTGILKKAITGQTVLISVGYVNNEVGTIQPIREIGELIKKINIGRKNKIYFHTDATQAIKYLDVSVDRLGVDLLSFTGHKINAPKGIGALYMREGVEIVRQMDGGTQERGLRAGTENVPYIVGLGKVIEKISSSKSQITNLRNIQKRLIKGILKIKGIELTGHPTERALHVASFVIDGVEGEAMVLSLSDVGIIASSGSACTSGDLRPSHVLTAMGFPPEKSHGSLRFSLDEKTTLSDINYVLEKLSEIVKNLRLMSPI
jgi:cysteine desulfurase